MSFKYIKAEDLDPKYNDCIFNYTPLCDAINNGDVNKATELINNGVKINYTDNKYIETPLGLSLYLNLIEVSKVLLTKKDLIIDMNDKELLDLLFTKLKGNEDFIYHKIYIQNLDFKLNDTELLELFFKHLNKQDLNDLIDRIYEKTKTLSKEFVNSYFEYNNNYYLLVRFIEKGGKIEKNINILKYILLSDLNNDEVYNLFLQLNNKAFDINDDINNNDKFIYSILYLVLERDNNKLLDYLLNNNIQLNYTTTNKDDILKLNLKHIETYNDFINILDKDNYNFKYPLNSILVYSIVRNKYNMIEYLIKHNIDINGDLNDITQTYIYLSILFKRYKIALLLLKSNIKIDYNITEFEQSLLYKLLNVRSVLIKEIDYFHQVKNILYDYYKQTDIFKQYLTDNNINNDNNVLNSLCNKLKLPFVNTTLPEITRKHITHNNRLEQHRIKIFQRKKYLNSMLLKLLTSYDYDTFLSLITNKEKVNSPETEEYLFNLQHKLCLHPFKKSYLYEALKLNNGLDLITEKQKEIIITLIDLYSNTYTEYDYYNLCNINNNYTLDIILNKLISYVNA